jgi:hypothetical protein
MAKTYTQTLGDNVCKAFAEADATHMQPKEVKTFRIDDDYTLRVYCYCWMVRHYSVWDTYWECQCSGNTFDWIIHEMTSY